VFVLEDDNFEVVVGEFDAAGDFEIAAIVADARDDGKAGAVLRAIHRDVEARDGAAELAKAAVPVGKFAEAVLELEIELVDDARIEPDAGHQNEVTTRLTRGIENAESDAHRDGVEQLLRGVIGAACKAELVGQNIGSAGGKNAEEHLRADETVDSFVDCAIAARGKDEIAARCNSLRGDLPRHSRTGRRERFDFGSGAAEDADSRIET